MAMTPLQSRLARAGIGLGVRETAFLAYVSPETITRIEKGEAVKAVTIDRVAAIYMFLGVIFIDDAEKPGLMVDLNRLSAVKTGAHNTDFDEVRRREGAPLFGLNAFLSVIESGRKWSAKDWEEGSVNPDPLRRVN